VLPLEVKDVIKTFNYAVENQIKFIIQGLEPEDFSWRPETGTPSIPPSIGWIIGHIAVFQDSVILNRVCKQDVRYETINKDFGFQTSGDFPSTYTHEKILEIQSNLTSDIANFIMRQSKEWFEITDPEMTEGFPPNWQGKNIMKIFVLHFNHCFTHCGQMLEIKRMLGKGAWGF
jgi:hypothetical protein